MVFTEGFMAGASSLPPSSPSDDREGEEGGGGRIHKLKREKEHRIN